MVTPRQDVAAAPRRLRGQGRLAGRAGRAWLVAALPFRSAAIAGAPSDMPSPRLGSSAHLEVWRAVGGRGDLLLRARPTSARSIVRTWPGGAQRAGLEPDFCAHPGLLRAIEAGSGATDRTTTRHAASPAALALTTAAARRRRPGATPNRPDPRIASTTTPRREANCPSDGCSADRPSQRPRRRSVSDRARTWPGGAQKAGLEPDFCAHPGVLRAIEDENGATDCTTTRHAASPASLALKAAAARRRRPGAAPDCPDPRIASNNCGADDRLSARRTPRTRSP